MDDDRHRGQLSEMLKVKVISFVHTEPVDVGKGNEATQLTEYNSLSDTSAELPVSLLSACT